MMSKAKYDSVEEAQSQLKKVLAFKSKHAERSSRNPGRLTKDDQVRASGLAGTKSSANRSFR